MNNKNYNLLSVKLPYRLEDVIKKTNGKGLIECKINLEGLINEPEHVIPIYGEMRKHCINPDRCGVKKRKVWYRTSLTLRHPPINLKAIFDDNLKQMSEHGFININQRITRFVFEIGNNKYLFTISAVGRGNVLTHINGIGIGEMSLETQMALLEGDLKFCAPSRCRMKYEKIFECED
jgi:hypothetical protein